MSDCDNVMKNVPENELFSAYLDGELTAEEQARVEQLLATSPEARQLVDELRALSTTLQNLPAYPLGEDLSGRVLRQAERQILTGASGGGETVAGKSEPAVPASQVPVSQAESGDGSSASYVPTPYTPFSWRRLISSRALAWSALAVAIAIIFMLNDPDQMDMAVKQPVGGDEVAMVPREAAEESFADKAPAAGEFAASEPAAEETAMRARGPSIAAPSIQTETAARKPGATAARESLAVQPQGGLTMGRDVTASPADSAATPPRVGKGGRGSGTMTGDGETAREYTVPGSTVPGSTVPGYSVAQDAAKPAAGAMAAKSAKTGGGMLSKSGERQVAAAAKAAPPTADDFIRQKQRMLRQAESDRLIPGGAPDGVMVVQCDITREALRQRAFEKLLTSNRIAWDDALDVRAEESGGSEGEMFGAKAAPGEPVSRRQGGQLAENYAAQADRRSLAGGVAGAGTLDVVYVEASPAQIEATLAGLASQRSEFVSVSVDPDPREVSQQPLMRFNRKRMVVGAPVVNGRPGTLQQRSLRQETMQVDTDAQSFEAKDGGAANLRQRADNATVEKDEVAAKADATEKHKVTVERGKIVGKSGPAKKESFAHELPYGRAQRLNLPEANQQIQQRRMPQYPAPAQRPTLDAETEGVATNGPGGDMAQSRARNVPRATAPPSPALVPVPATSPHKAAPSPEAPANAGQPADRPFAMPSPAEPLPAQSAPVQSAPSAAQPSFAPQQAMPPNVPQYIAQPSSDVQQPAASQPSALPMTTESMETPSAAAEQTVGQEKQAPTYRVLFVLRVVDTPGADAASAIRAAPNSAASQVETTPARPADLAPTHAEPARQQAVPR